MATIKDIAIGMSVNPKDFNQGLNSADSRLTKFTERLKSLNTGVGGKLTALGGAIGGGLLGALALKGTVEGIAEIAMKGAEMNALLGKTGVIFGDSARIILDEADAIADRFGVVRGEFINAAVDLGSMFKGAGASQKEAAKLGVTMAKLGIDMASFSDAVNQDAFGALKSALKGESDPIEAFLVTLNAEKIATEAVTSGLAKNKNEIDDLAKKTATLNLILKQTRDAQGDLARTFNETGNQVKATGGRFENLKVEAGLAILPITEAVSKLANSAMVELTKAISGNRDAVMDWAQQNAAATGAVYSGFAQVGVGIAATVNIIQDLGIAFKAVEFGILNFEYAAIRAFTAAAKVIDALLAKIAGAKPEDFSAWDADVAAAKAAAIQAQQDLAAARNQPWNGDKIIDMFARIKDSASQMSASVATSVKSMGKEVSEAAFAMSKAIGDLEAKFKFELATSGMSSRMAEIHKLATQGATAAQLKNVRALGLQLDAKDQLAAAKSLPTHAGAALEGSTEAYSARLRFKGQETTDSTKNLVKKADEQVVLQKQMTGLLGKCASALDAMKTNSGVWPVTGI